VLNENEHLAKSISLCDAIDRLLNKGVVITGDITISVAGVDLLYIGLRGLVCAVDALGELPQSLCHHNRSTQLFREAS
jgi:hypothetical protein